MDSSRFFLNSDRILTEFWCQKFDIFDRSPIESFNPGPCYRGYVPLREARRGERSLRHRYRRRDCRRCNRGRRHPGYLVHWSSPGRSLVERFDTEFNPDFSAKSPNFRGLVLFCIEADFCTQIRIFQHFSRTTRFAILCTAPISKFERNFVKLFRIFADFLLLLQKSLFFNIFHRILQRFSSKFHGISPNILKNDEKSSNCRISNGF